MLLVVNFINGPAAIYNLKNITYEEFNKAICAANASKILAMNNSLINLSRVRDIKIIER
jgi:hypothetical protein